MKLLKNSLALKQFILSTLLIMFSGFVFADQEGFARKYEKQSFESGIEIKVDGKPYYFGGMPVDDNGATDVPGHSWVQIAKDELIGYHKNTDRFWSSDAAEDQLLYVVEVKIDIWSEVKAAYYYANGYTHHHHLVSAKTGMPHPTKVAWLKHVAVGNFTLNKGPHPEFYHVVVPGVDYLFVPNWQMAYDPSHHMP